MSIPRAVLRSTAQMRHRTRKALDVVHLELQKCVDSNVGPSELLRRFDNISDALCQVIDTADFVRCVHPDSSFRDSATEAIQTLSECIQHLNTNQDLYERLANLKRNIEDLNGEERRMAETLRSDFQENGIHLPDDIRARIRNIQYEIAIAGNEFSDNVNTMSIPVRISTDVARVLPNQMRAHVHEYDDFVTVPSFHPFNQTFMQHVPISSERKKMFEAANSTPINATVLERLLCSRRELATLTGHESYAHLKLSSNTLIREPEEVEHFLNVLGTELRPKLREEISLLRSEKRELEGGGDDVFYAWDEPFYKPRVVSNQICIDPSSIREYFTIDSVLRGVGNLFERVFGVKMKEVHVENDESWCNPRVRKFAFFDVDSLMPLGHVYLDLYARPGKPPCASHYVLRCARLDMDRNTRQSPLVAISCAFTQGNESLTMWAADTLVHEFGHALHSVVSKSSFQHLSGTRVSMDVVEIPALLLSKFLWDPRTMSLFSKEQSLPRDVAEQVSNSERTFVALDRTMTVTQGLLDLRLHGTGRNFDDDTIRSELERIQDEYFNSVGYHRGTFWHTNFTHLVTYGASYFTYLFGQAYANILWNRHFDKNPLELGCGKALRKQLLEVGNAASAESMFPNDISLDDSVRVLL